MNCVEYGPCCGVLLVFVALSVCDALEPTYSQRLQSCFIFRRVPLGDSTLRQGLCVFLRTPTTEKTKETNRTFKFAKTAVCHVLWSSALTVFYMAIYI